MILRILCEKDTRFSHFLESHMESHACAVIPPILGSLNRRWWVHAPRSSLNLRFLSWATGPLSEVQPAPDQRGILVAVHAGITICHSCCFRSMPVSDGSTRRVSAPVCQFAPKSNQKSSFAPHKHTQPLTHRTQADPHLLRLQGQAAEARIDRSSLCCLKRGAGGGDHGQQH